MSSKLILEQIINKDINIKDTIEKNLMERTILIVTEKKKEIGKTLVK